MKWLVLSALLALPGCATSGHMKGGLLGKVVKDTIKEGDIKLHDKKVILEAPIPTQDKFSITRTIPIDVLRPRYKCLEGWKLVGRKCVKEEIEEAALVCEDGGELVGGRCEALRVSHAGAICPLGFVRHTHGKCISVEERAALVRCPIGDLENGLCRIREERDADLSCAAGFAFSPDGFCFRETKSKAKLVCPTGSQPSGKGCVRRLVRPAEASCPPGYTLRGDICERTLDAVLARTCRKGYELSELPDGEVECVREVTVPGELVCPVGELVEGMCLEIREEAPERTCRPGFSLADGRCVRVLEELPRLKCEIGELEGGSCVERTRSDPEVVCPDGTRRPKTRGCAKLETDPVIERCPPGYDPIGDTELCRQVLTRDQLLNCNTGERLQGKQCIRDTRVEVSQECQDGRRHGSLCLHYETRAPLTHCAKGEERDSINDTCKTVSIRPPRVTCDPGFVSNGTACKRVRTAKAQIACERGEMTQTGHKKKCVQSTTSLPSFACQPGFDFADDRTCVRVQVTDARPTCPDGYLLIKGECVPLGYGEIEPTPGYQKKSLKHK